MRGRGRGGWRRISRDDDDDDEEEEEEEEEEHKSSSSSSSGDEGSDESEEAIRLEMEENEQDEEDEEEEEEDTEYAEGEIDMVENNENHTQQQQDLVDADAEDQDDEEEEEEGEEEEDDEQPVPPKLDEGFFEIEDVRRKRVRKGQTQYCIKWRGWPETSNTWEPIENLQACSDVVEAFEESLRSGSGLRGRKRKRRGSLSQPKKTQQRTPSSNVAGSRKGRKPRSLTSPSVDSSRPLIRPLRHRVASKSVYGEPKGNEKNEGGFENEDSSNVDTTAQQTENGNGSSKAYELRERTSTDNLNSESEKVSIHFSDMRTSDMVEGHSVGLPKVDFDENTQSNRFTGARRRKSGNVKRFKKEDARNWVGNGEGPTGDDHQKLERLSNLCSITKIIKPIGYSASISNDVQNVCVTFVATSSDGREVVVDNKQLKSDNPQLLISFYEQHLRYSPPA